MAATKEGNRFLYLETPLGPDALLLRGFRGSEAFNQLFTFQLDLWAENTVTVDFDKLLGQHVSFGVGLEKKDQRHFMGTVVELSQGGRGSDYTDYRMVVAPDIWRLSRKSQSRIFQQISVPDILKKVLAGFDVVYEIQGTFEPREYCVQYRESDFDFISRLMEEEGIFYFFRFPDKGQQKLVLGNMTSSHGDVPINSKIVFDTMAGGGDRGELRITGWEKAQFWGSGKHTRRDHNFGLPAQQLEKEQTVRDSVSVGKVQHKLKVAGNDKMEVYDYPGGYAKRFDGINKSGGEQAGNLAKIFPDDTRTVGIEVQETEARTLLVQGESNCRQMIAGHKFTLQRHFNADDKYVLAEVSHEAREGSFRSGDDQGGEPYYGNTFACIPFALPYRPPFVTPQPTISGPQTAKVVGPAGDEIFTDKYGRVKVQFHWDREGKNNADSSCWLRVGTLSAGNIWGSIYIPRIGMDVIVSFMEGDPDRPLIVGCVYNPEQMPPYTLPDKKTVSTIKSHSTKGGSKDNFNELRFEDLKGSEQLFLHAEKDKDERVKAESREYVGASRHMKVVNDLKEDIGGEWHTKVATTRALEVGGDQSENLKGALTVKVAADHQQKTGANYLHEAGQEIHLKAGMKVIIEAGVQITLKGPGGFVDIGPSGVTIQGIMVLINSGGAAGVGSPVTAAPTAPDKPDEADDGTKFGKAN